MLIVRGKASELVPREMSGDRLMEIQSHVTPYLCGLGREDSCFLLFAVMGV